MPDLIALQLFWRENDQIHKRDIVPEDWSRDGMKRSLIPHLRELKTREGIEYYYVVLKARRSDGQLGYRTIIPKTIP